MEPETQIHPNYLNQNIIFNFLFFPNQLCFNFPNSNNTHTHTGQISVYYRSLIERRPRIPIISNASRVIPDEVEFLVWGGRQRGSVKTKTIYSIDLKSVIKNKGKSNQQLHNFYTMLFVIKSYLFFTNAALLLIELGGGGVTLVVQVSSLWSWIISVALLKASCRCCRCEGW